MVFAGQAVAGQLHVFTSDAAGFNTHSAWYDDGQEVTVVDTQFLPAIAEKLIADIRKQSKSPITRVIITHPNPDKFNGISAFHKEGVESIASAKTADAIPGVDAYKRYFWVKLAKAFTDESYPRVEPVKTTFSGKMKIKLKSGETLTLFELEGAGVSSNQTVVRIDESGDLIVGDLVHTKNHAWLEGGIVDGKPTPSLSSWKADLKQLLKLGSGKVIGGRGEFVPVKEAVAQQIAYLDKADTIVNTYIKQLGATKNELSDPAMQGMHYTAIQAEFVKAFPGYAMPDLIGYSIYGLTQQKLARSQVKQAP
jgi:glyoxylase-like metal-dependent hydrolase (beta-lactamase superfamily II)